MVIGRLSINGGEKVDETRPRDLTAEELMQIDARTVRLGGSSPLRIPPGNTVPIELFNPAAEDVSVPSAPAAGPDEKRWSDPGGHLDWM
jgi:hypothetical protein